MPVLGVAERPIVSTPEPDAFAGDRHDEIDTVSDLREIRRFQLGLRTRRRAGLAEVLNRQCFLEPWGSYR
jgi:hypothetical protein